MATMKSPAPRTPRAKLGEAKKRKRVASSAKTEKRKAKKITVESESDDDDDHDVEFTSSKSMKRGIEDEDKILKQKRELASDDSDDNSENDSDEDKDDDEILVQDQDQNDDEIDSEEEEDSEEVDEEQIQVPVKSSRKKQEEQQDEDSESSSSDDDDDADDGSPAGGKGPVSLFSKRPKSKKDFDAEAQAKRAAKAESARKKKAARAQVVEKRIIDEDEEKPDHDDDAWTFEGLGISEWLASTCFQLGMIVPTAVQRACIPATLAGKNIIGSAPTGSGKTAAFALPILNSLAQDMYGVYAVVLTPTRELAFQIGDQFNALGAPIQLRCCVVVGGTNQVEEATALSRRPHVVVATPGRLGAHLRSAIPPKLNHVAYVVLDEADRLMDPGFARDLGTLFKAVPKERQTLLYSATINEALVQIKQSTEGTRGLFEFAVSRRESTPEGLDQRYVLAPQQVKLAYLAYLLRRLGPLLTEGPLRPGSELMKKKKLNRSRASMAGADGTDRDASLHKVTSRSEPGFERDRAKLLVVFVSSCQACQTVGQTLLELGVSCSILHSGLSQPQRLAALGKFRQRTTSVLVATDVASRGLDIPQVDLVINYDVPRTPEDYIHRVGRTARAGRSGLSVTLVTQYEVKLVLAVEEHTGIKMKLLPDIDEEKDILVLLSRVTKANKMARLRIADSGIDDEIRARRQQRRRRPAEQ
mmetsp:Transcript_935/g.2190  ORF Transcript_935/g.2190 Transcript_935/m.2190 type:complete len:700 (+) Transcript_935:147-2246(+)|eukprot:CAMPEP_0171495372 /NCGR_PEP_ID=MMETSP0958-20121227/6112_1 /TAXON_ID=87120 /ORGANISM="Aurantiochytrium limacinum, Strain ATCCMYA-1381" /LENGTH=699 /DNA_ID=CAMNT_0012029361 /DNA_START=26 /DNA_END=2125 /DNA_ORIENTATION=+